MGHGRTLRVDDVDDGCSAEFDGTIVDVADVDVFALGQCDRGPLDAELTMGASLTVCILARCQDADVAVFTESSVASFTQRRPRVLGWLLSGGLAA